MIRHTRIGYGSSNSCPNNTLGSSRRRFVNSFRLYRFLPVQSLITASYRVVVVLSITTRSYRLPPRRPGLVITCSRRASIFSFFAFSRGGRQTVLHCANRAPTALPWGLCEQEGWLLAPSHRSTPRAVLSCGCLAVMLTHETGRVVLGRAISTPTLR